MRTASVIISTKDRRDDLCRALSSLRDQRAVGEIIVLDDGSTDGTSDLVRDRFPDVKLVVSQFRRGYIVQRNKGAKIAKHDFLVYIDDDCTFTDVNTIEHSLKELDVQGVGAVAIPYKNIRISDTLLTAAPSADNVWVTSSFVGCSHVIKKQVFELVGGHWEELFHYGEETDFCLRMLSAGFACRLGSAPPIHHHVSNQQRIRAFNRKFAARCGIMLAWHNTPQPYLLPHLLALTLRELPRTLRHGLPMATLQGVWSGHLAGLRHWPRREPVSREAFAAFRRLNNREKPMTLGELSAIVRISNAV